MAKLLITILSAFLFSNIVWANPAVPMIENNSLSKAMIKIVARDYQPKTAPKIETSSTHYTHERTKNSSFLGAVLAKQGVKMNLIINSESKVNYSRHKYTGNHNNSLFLGALAK